MSSSDASTSDRVSPNRVARRSRSRSPSRDSDQSSGAARNSSPARKVRRLERKIQTLEEKIETLPTDTKFTYASNKDQFDVNSCVLKALHAAKRASTSSKSRRRISQAIAKLEHRNKLIRMADSSKAGWKAVELYRRLVHQ